jgi:hypothetical protein
MKAFNIWLRPQDGASRVRVEAIENAEWLLGRLSALFVFKTCEPVHERFDSAECTFRIAHNSQLSGPRLERLLSGIHEVRVHRETEPLAPLPASNN